jgi:hypothetical protein
MRQPDGWLGSRFVYGREWTSADAAARRGAAAPTTTTTTTTLAQRKPAKPTPPPGPPPTGSRQWAAQLIAKYGTEIGTDFMRRDLSLADAAKEHGAKLAKAEADKHAAQMAELAKLNAEHDRLTAELARRERPRHLGVRFAQPACRPFGKHAQRPGGPDHPTAA